MPSKDIQTAHQKLQDVWDQIKNDYIAAMPGKYLVLTCVHRDKAEQLELYKKGRILGTDGKWVVQDKAKIVTNVDGENNIGAHNYSPSRAIDVAVVDNSTGEYIWDERFYYPLSNVAGNYGLVHGGTWKSIKDYPHIELPDYRNGRWCA